MRRALRLLGPLALLAAPAAAQELSDAELLALFRQQADAVRQTQENGLGATRSLEILTAEDLAALTGQAPPAEAPAVPAAAPATEVAAETAAEPPSESTVVADTAAPAGPGDEVPPEEAVVAAAPEGGAEAGPLVQDDVAGLDLVASAAPEGGPAAAAVTEGVAVVAADPLAAPDAPGEAPGILAALAAATQPGAPRPAAVALDFDPTIQVNVRVGFAYDSAVLEPGQLPKLEQMCRVMRERGDSLYRIVGHTDAAGSDAYNQRLSQLRAEEVRRWFVGTCGLPAASLEAIGMGETLLLDASDPRGPDNRRVEFQALS